MPVSFTEVVAKVVNGVLTATPGVWIQLRNNATGALYTSSGAADVNSVVPFTGVNVPPGVYTVRSGPAQSGPFTDSTETGYLVPAAPLAGWTVVVKTANYTAAADDAVLANAAGGAFTVTLPAAALGSAVIVKKTDSSANAVTVAPGAGTIDGVATFGIKGVNHAITFVSDGTNWFVIHQSLMDGLGNLAVGSLTSSISPYVSSAPAGGVVAGGRPWIDVRVKGAKCDLIDRGDGAMSSVSNQTTLTSGTGPFVAADVGKLISVWGAGAASADLRTTITAFISATQVTLGASCATTVSNAQFYYGTGDDVAIQAAIDALGTDNYNNSGGWVIQSGLSAIQAKITNRNRVAYVGIGRNLSGVTAMGSFPNNTELVRLMDTSGGIAFGCRIENMVVNCNNWTGSVGVYSERINEQSGVFRVLIQNFLDAGLRINQPGAGAPPQNYIINDVEIYGGPKTVAASLGIDLLHGGISDSPRYIKGVTITSTTTPLTTAMKIDGVYSTIEDIHIEQATTGMQIGGTTACTGLTVMGVYGLAGVTNLVRISNTTVQNAITLIGIVPNGSTNSVVDQITGKTITGVVPLYVLGGGSPANSMSMDGSANSEFLNLLAARGTAAALGFQNRNSSNVWQWYADTNGSHLFDGTTDHWIIAAATGFLSRYGKATTQGTGVPAIYQAPAPLTGQTGAVASVATLTSPNDGAKHTYMVSVFVTITTLGSGSFNAQVSYTDSGGTARTCNVPLAAQAGTFGALANTADDYKGTVEITVNPNTAVTIKTAGTFTGCTYNVGGNIKQVL